MGDMIPVSGGDSSLQSFFGRKEGKVGAGFLALGAVAVIYFWGLIVPYIETMLVDTVHTAILAVELAAIAWVLFSSRSHLIFRVLMRSLTGLFVSVYPVEIAEDKLQQMKKRRDKMNDQIGEVNGQITTLKRTMDDNHRTAVKGFANASQAQKMAGAAEDQETALRMALQVKAQARKAQRRENANVGYQLLLDKLTKIYKFLTNMAAHIDFFIEDTQDELDQQKTEYKTTNAAFSAVKSALKVISGNTDENDIYNQAAEKMQEEIGRKLGIMDDMQRVSQNFMDGMSIEEGAVDEQALAALNAYETKLLASGDADMITIMPTTSSVPSRQPVYVPRAGTTTTTTTTTTASDEYDPFK